MLDDGTAQRILHTWRAGVAGLLIVAAQPAAGGASMLAVGLDAPKPAILLFWAAWCAPCRAEIADYARIAAAADPVSVVVVSLDTPKRRAEDLLVSIPPERLRVTSLSTIDIVSNWPEAAGLPLAIAVDRRGKTCGVINGRLTSVRVADLLSRCGNAP